MQRRREVAPMWLGVGKSKGVLRLMCNVEPQRSNFKPSPPIQGKARISVGFTPALENKLGKGLMYDEAMLIPGTIAVPNTCINTHYNILNS